MSACKTDVLDRLTKGALVRLPRFELGRSGFEPDASTGWARDAMVPMARFELARRRCLRPVPLPLGYMGMVRREGFEPALSSF